MTEIEKIEPGTRLGRYECLHPIGKGGMGAVWAAQVVGDESDKIVAVKTVLPQHADNPDYVDMLLDEGRILSGIRHPNVASLLDMGSQDGAFYLAFEWVEGEQLSQLRGALKKKQLVMPVGLPCASWQRCAVACTPLTKSPTQRAGHNASCIETCRRRTSWWRLPAR